MSLLYSIYFWSFAFAPERSSMQNSLRAIDFAISADCLREFAWIVRIAIILLCALIWQTTWLLQQRRRFRQRLKQKLQQSRQRFDRLLNLQDITERRQAEAALQQQSRQLADVLLLQQEIAAKSPILDEVMALIVDRVQQLTGADGSVIEMVEGSELVYRAANGVAAAHVGLRLNINTSLSGYCIQTGEILSCPDTETDSRVNIAACRQTGIRSMVVVPLSLQGQTIGVLKTFAAVPNRFTEQNVQTLQLIAGFLSNTLRLFFELQAKEQVLTALQTSEERYRSVIAALSEGITLQNADGTICATNASAEQILGLTTDQIMGRSSLDPHWYSIHEDGSPFPGSQHPAMVTLRTGKPCRNVIMGISKPDGQLTWISINSQPLFHPGELLPYAVVTSFSDITERQQMEVALRESQQQLSLALEGSGDGLWDWRIDTGAVYVSSRWLEMLEYTEGDLPSTLEMWQNMMHPDDRSWVFDRLNDHLNDSTISYQFEYRVRTKSGQ